MQVTTAVIFASGFGSRMLPVTSAVQKELLPILDRPIVDYIVSDCVAAGITNIIFVIRPNSHGLQDYYVGNPVLEGHLKRFGKDKLLTELDRIHSQAVYTFVEQREDAGYGTAVPMKLAAPHLPKNEAFVVAYGDAILWHADQKSEIKALVETFNDANADSAIMSLEKPAEELHKYGVLKLEEKDGHEFLKGFVEKPARGEEPSNLVNLGMYVFKPEFMKYVEKVKVNDSGELFLTDAILEYAQNSPMAVHRATGRFLDAGSVKGWLEANRVVAESRPDLA